MGVGASPASPSEFESEFSPFLPSDAEAAPAYGCKLGMKMSFARAIKTIAPFCVHAAWASHERFPVAAGGPWPNSNFIGIPHGLSG